MRVGLVVPCYIDVFYPEVGIAALELLEKLGVEVEYPFDQTCCGQPMANSGCESDARATEELFVRNFEGFEYIVIPSGSCTHHVRNKFIAAPLTVERENVRSHTYDIVEFLHDVMQVKEFPWAEFGHKVALHTSCSAIRGIFMQSMSERVHDPKFSKPKDPSAEGYRRNFCRKLYGYFSGQRQTCTSGCTIGTTKTFSMGYAMAGFNSG
jgi:L-lactate dehydrogenase complex protein LldE